MNKTAIKNYAIWARVQLIESAKQRAFEYAISDGENDSNLEIINGRILSADEKRQRSELISLIKQKGFEQVMEEAAYTWFNRFIALRFMEVNGYLPTKVRVFTDENNEFKPQILKEAMTVELEGIDREKVLEFLDKQDNEGLFKYLLILQCNNLSANLPGMFETISNWTELLFPANLLKADSVIGQMISTIPEEDWTDQVQIIGWMYQYYNSELKDDTFAKLKKNIKISKERIPAATQLFTPDWIVRYMVENSLGRLWYEGHPDFDKSEWKYYLDEAQQEPEVEEQLKKIREEYAQIKPEEIKVIDPCMGSGHILVYAFDVLMQIYTSAGWSERDAAKSILENNLFGLDIDDRAGQMAYFAVMMKARKYNRRILNEYIRPKVMSIQESNGIDINLERLGPEKPIAEKLIRELKDAKEYGSILNLSIKQEELDALKLRLEDIDEMADYGSLLVQYESYQIIDALYPLIELAEVMIQKYDVVVTNPPYMSLSNAGTKINEYVLMHYPEAKMDLFTVFIAKCSKVIKANAYQAMITQHGWMFLGSFEKMRAKIVRRTISSMAHLGARAFEEIGGEVVQTTAFVFHNSNDFGYNAKYERLIDYTSQQLKEKAFLAHKDEFVCTCKRFCNIPGMPIAYWISEAFANAFSGKLLKDYADTKQGFATGNNDLFLRNWQEVSFKDCQLSSIDISEARRSNKKWFPCNKGGSYRKWYGNNYYLVNWEHDGQKMRNFHGSVIRNPQYYFMPGITWSSLANQLSLRYSPDGFTFESKGSMCFPKKKEDLFYLLGALNSKITSDALSVLSPTLDFHEGPMSKVPMVMIDNKYIVDRIVNNNIYISKSDWDSFETSWDFKKHPLV